MKHEANKQIAFGFVSLVLALLILLLPQQIGIKVEFEYQIIYAVLCIILVMIADLIQLLYRYLKIKIPKAKEWENRTKIEMELSNVRHFFDRITADKYGDHDLFVSHFEREIHNLFINIKDAANTSELFIDGNHFLNTKNVLDAFSEKTEKTWRYTWPFQVDNDPLFLETFWKQYFETTFNMLESGKVNSIKALLIFSEEKAMDTPRVKNLLDFFKTTPKMDCRLMLKSEYEQICTGDGFPLDQNDFGVYSSELLYINTSYDPVQGTFIKDRESIEKYRNLFDLIWDLTGICMPNDSKARKKMSIAELFKFDKTPTT